VSRTTFALFDDALAALGAAGALEREGVSREAITLLVPDPRGRYARPPSPDAPNTRVFQTLDGPEFGPAAVTGPLAFAAASGRVPEIRRYAENVRAGNAVLAVEATDEIRELLLRFGAQRVEESDTDTAAEGPEYLQLRPQAGPLVRVHRRVLAGIEKEPTPEFRALLLGTSSEREVVVEDFARLEAGAAIDPKTGWMPGERRPSLPVVGAGMVRRGDDLRLTDADGAQIPDSLPVLLLFQRSRGGVQWADAWVRTPGPDAVGEPPEPEGVHRYSRYLWPAVAALAGLLIVGAAYVTADRDARRAQARIDATAKPEQPPLAGWKPAPPPPQPAPQAAVVTPPAAVNEADRTTETGDVRHQIRSVLEEWRESLLHRNVDEYTSLYAPTVGPYFRENRVSRAQIANEVRRMLGRYGPLTAYKISNVTIAPVDQNHAIANFRKEWKTAGDGFSGAERAQLRFERLNGDWRITSEQELQVYWARKK
jgi:hypothetical protein